MRSEKINLERFLAKLPADEAAQAQVAAVKIDELERATQHLQAVERKYVPWLIVAIISFVAAIMIVTASNELFGQARRLIGVLGVTAMAAVLPVLGMVYTYNVRERTKADRAKLELNREHFISRGGYYFPAGDSRQGHVFLIKETGEDEKNAKQTKDLRAGWYW